MKNHLYRVAAGGALLGIILAACVTAAKPKPDRESVDHFMWGERMGGGRTGR